MRVLAMLFAASMALAARASEEEVVHRELYPATFRGWAYWGPTRNQPTNACYNFERYPDPPKFSDCDGAKSALAYCQSRGYTRVTSFEVAPLRSNPTHSTWVPGSAKVVEAGIDDNQMAIKDVVCDRDE